MTLMCFCRSISLTVMALLACAAPASVWQPEPPQTRSWDTRVEALGGIAQIVRSIDPDNREFSDLDGLKAAIGTSRVVVLGEPTHGDGAAFLAKCRLVVFLHQELGFDVLAWESGMFDCFEADRLLDDPGVQYLEAASVGVPAMWTMSAQVQPLLAYVHQTRRTDRPLSIAGIDHVCVGSRGWSGWSSWVLKMFDRADPEALSDAMRRAIIDGPVEMMGTRPGDSAPGLRVLEQWRELRTTADDHAQKMVAVHGRDDAELLIRTIDDAIAAVEWVIAQHDALRDPRDRDAQRRLGVRDERMGENLIWLANERYRDRKIIVWVANFHALHKIQDVSGGMAAQYRDLVTAGEHARRILGDELFTIGITASSGTMGRLFMPAEQRLAPSPRGSLEDVCDRLGHLFLLVPLRDAPEEHWVRGTFIARLLGYIPMSARWAEQVDAVLYIRTMFPAVMDRRAPDGVTLTAP